MRCEEMIQVLEELAAQSMACSWDNPGLLVGWREKEIKKVYVALDATDQAIEDAVREGADLLLTHHPMIFKPLKKIDDGDFIGRRVIRLIQKGICCYAMHTNFDSAPGCMADLAAGRLGLTHCQILAPEGAKDGAAYGIGRVGTLPGPLTLRQLAQRVKEVFGLPFVTVYGDLGDDRPLLSCAVSPGSGGSMIQAALGWKADVLVTGDIGHHDGIDSVARQMAVIDAGHYGLEHIFVDYMERYLKERLGDQVQVVKAPVVFPAAVL